MEDFMRYIATGCIAFTFSNLFYLFFSSIGTFAPFSNEMVFTMFLLSLSIMLLIYLTHLMPIENSMIARLLELFSIVIVLMSSSFVFDIFPFTLQYLLPTLIIGILTYVLVIVVSFVGNQASAKRINALINRDNEVKIHD